MNKDLTTGKPEKVLWQFCLPLFGSIIFQQLYNIADSFVAGKFISDNALAAVGNSYEITLIFIAFAFGCNIACSVLAALFFGAKQYNDLKTTVYTALISSCVICAALMLVGTLCCDSLLRLIKTPEEVFADSKLYLDIYIYGLPFVFLYNVATGIFSALGDSKTPFIFLACSSTSNIAVDILFVTAFNMGVAGVAWATFLCQGISCVLALVVVFRRFAKIPTEGKVKIFLVEPFWTVRGHRHSEHLAAELYFRRQHHHPERHQQLRRGRHGRLLCGGEAQQHGYHVPYHARQRHFQLYGAEPRGQQI